MLPLMKDVSLHSYELCVKKLGFGSNELSSWQLAESLKACPGLKGVGNEQSVAYSLFFNDDIGALSPPLDNIRKPSPPKKRHNVSFGSPQHPVLARHQTFDGD